MAGAAGETAATVSDEAPTERELDAAGEALAGRAGLSLSAGLRTTLRQAVLAAARQLGLAPAALARRAAAGEEAALDALAGQAVVGETSFWRHAEGLAALTARLAPRPGPLRLWSAGCASGEEPYGLAMALLEAGRAGRGDRILATDLSAAALRTARAGRYGERPLRRLPPALAARWLSTSGGLAEVAPAVRALVALRRHNLLDAPPEDGFDAVVCRNVLIYFEPEVARRALGRLAGALAPGGLLLLGPVELPLAHGAGLEWLEQGGAVLLRRPGP
jgi:chemotaxis protein methyltransferase CheR